MAAARAYGYEDALHPWLLDGAQLLHRLCNGDDTVKWREEIPRLRDAMNPYSEVRPLDVAED